MDHMTPSEKLAAMRARLEGDFDNAALAKVGPLGDRVADISVILALPEITPPRWFVAVSSADGIEVAFYASAMSYAIGIAAAERLKRAGEIEAHAFGEVTL